jgi:transposase InsO family protein
MIKIRREKGFIAPLLFYQELVEQGYQRSYGGMKRFLRRRFGATAEPRVSKEKPKLYEGGLFPGERVQIDVKYVPRACLYGEKLYQYTLVDEFSRWCYREVHAEQSAHASNLFLRNAVKRAPFRIHAAQTDNGHEFTNALFGQKREEPTRFELALAELGIEYRRIRVGTPKHNGRVERQHGLDMQRFYKRQKFLSLEDARGKMAVYNAWSNTRIKTCLGLCSPIQIIQGFAA